MKKLEENQLEDGKHPLPELLTTIGEHVMRTLGQPDGLHRIQVCKLWADRYRVNVLTGPDAASVMVAHSFFLVTDGEGNIVAATPRITKQY